MKFRWQDREFDGPTILRGPLGGFTIGELRLAKKELGLALLDQLDTGEAEVLYCLLTIRRTDHTLLPLSKFEDVAPADFELIEHPARLDRNGFCDDCGRRGTDPVHAGELVPTAAGETATP